MTGLLYVDAEAEDLHSHLDTVAAPLNTLGEKELCPGSTALEKINAELALMRLHVFPGCGAARSDAPLIRDRRGR